MSVTALISIVVALLAMGAASNAPSDPTVCGPFGITTTSGTLYSAPNGTQLPGIGGTPLESGRYVISYNGTLMNYNGSLCEFRPYLICLPNVTRSEGDGGFAIGEYGVIYYNNNRTFNRCSPVKDGPLWANLRIFPGGPLPGDDSGSGVATCDVLAMQASRCHPGHRSSFMDRPAQLPLNGPLDT